MEDKRIGDFLDGIEQMFSNMQTVDFWPAHAPQMDSYYIDILAKDFYLAIQKLKKEKTNKEIAGLFDFASVVRSLLYNPLIVGMKVVRHYKMLPISLEDNLEFVSFIFDVLGEKTDDPFCLNKTNRILSRSELSALLRNDFFEVKGNSKELASFNLGLQSAMWSVCFDVLASYGLEIHGPYDVSKSFGPGSVMIVRDFFDFKQPVWNFHLGFGNVRVLNVYRGVKFEFDFANHYITDKPPVSHLTHWCVLVDGSPVDFSGLKNLHEKMIALRKDQVSFVNSLKPQEIIEKSAEINYYTFRRVWEAAGKDGWLFSMDKVRDFVKKQGLKYWDKFNLRRPEPLSHYRKLYDPRLDYPIK